VSAIVNWLQGKKTYITGAAAVLTAVAGVATGQVGAAEAVQMGLTGLMGIFLRNGLANK
jgi:hypothetical protein